MSVKRTAKSDTRLICGAAVVLAAILFSAVPCPAVTGYFVAPERRPFQLMSSTCETMLTLHGAGHLVGRQFSVITDEPTGECPAPAKVVLAV